MVESNKQNIINIILFVRNSQKYLCKESDEKKLMTKYLNAQACKIKLFNTAIFFQSNPFVYTFREAANSPNHF